MGTKYGRAGWIGMQQNRHGVPAKCLFHFIFSLGHFSFFMFPIAGSTKQSEFSQQHFQLRLLWSNNCELHAMLHCWQLYCFMFDILTARGERYYPPVMRRTEENNAGTFETARKMNLLHFCEKHAFRITLFKAPRHLNFLSELPSWSISSLGEKGEDALDLSYKQLTNNNRLCVMLTLQAEVFRYFCFHFCVQHFCVKSPSADKWLWEPQLSSHGPLLASVSILHRNWDYFVIAHKSLFVEMNAA